MCQAWRSELSSEACDRYINRKGDEQIKHNEGGLQRVLEAHHREEGYLPPSLGRGLSWRRQSLS